MKTIMIKRLVFLPAAVALVLGLGGWAQNAVAQNAPQTVAATPVAPPPNIIPGSPFAEVVRLTQAGVDQAIIMTFVTNSTGTFNLNSDKIIYLTNLGTPTTLITAMMQRDQQLQEQFAAAQAAQQAQQAPPPAATEQTPATENATTNTEEVTSPPPPVTVNYFYDSLAPYGSWVTVSGYGNCWRPTVCVYNSNWQPYCDQGHWVYTDCGWYWASDYAWGATFHYGRWFLAAGYGWVWYPDTVWAPSWVTWRYSNNYCGWAPLPPRTAYQSGVGIVYNGGGVSVGFGFGLGANCFTFVPTRYFCSPHPRNYCVARSQVAQVYNNTAVINNYNLNNRTIVNHGIAVQNVAAASRTTIHAVPVRRMDSSYMRAGHGQQDYHSSYNAGIYHPAGTRDFGSPLRSPQGSSPPPSWVAKNNNYSQPYYQNGTSSHASLPRSTANPGQVQGQHGVPAATIPQQHTAPAASYHSYLPGAVAPAPPAEVNNGHRQSSPSSVQSLETPRNMTRYSEPHQYYRPPSAVVPPQASYGHASAPSQSAQGGYHYGHQNGNQNGSPH
jgi:hypothetical protein